MIRNLMLARMSRPHLEEALFEAVTLLDDFLNIGPDEQIMTGYTHSVQKYFRRYDFDEVVPVKVRQPAEIDTDPF
jgi:hypothetical protein